MMEPFYCYIHGVTEWATEDSFVCFECKHVYPVKPSAAYCDHCLHDF